MHGRHLRSKDFGKCAIQYSYSCKGRGRQMHQLRAAFEQAVLEHIDANGYEDRLLFSRVFNLARHD